VPTLKLLEVMHKLAVDQDVQEQFARAPVAFLNRVGISPETARVLAPILTTVLATGIVLAVGGNSPQYQWEDPHA